MTIRLLLQIGYRATNVSEFRPLMWHPSQEPHAKPSDGTWGCPDAAQPYPAMHHSLVHPCTSPVGGCCGLPQASFNLRFHSFLAAPKGMLLMAYEVLHLLSVGCITELCWLYTFRCLPGRIQPPIRVKAAYAALPGMSGCRIIDGKHVEQEPTGCCTCNAFLGSGVID